MEFYDLMFLGIFLILLLAVLVWRDRKTWQFCEQIVVAIIGASFLFCNCIAKYTGSMKETELDDTLVWSCRLVGVFLLSHATLLYLNRKSVDTYTQTIILYPGIMTGCLVLMMFLVEMGTTSSKSTGQNSKPAEITDQRKVSLLLVLWWLLANLFFVASTEYYGRSQLYSRLNTHLRIDFLITFIFGILLFAFPVFVLKAHTTLKVNSVLHVASVRWIAALLISSALVSVHAPSFLMEGDKRNVLLVRLVSNIVIILGLLYLQTSTKLLSGRAQWAVLLAAISTINASFGYYSPHETEHYKAKDN